MQLIKPLTGTILLAAGKSERMGTPKQLLPFRNKTLLQHLISVAGSVSHEKIIVVTGAYKEEVESSVSNLPLQLFHNVNWEVGMGSSLSAGIYYATELWPELESLIIMLCDQPLVDKTVLTQLLNQHKKTGKAIVASEYEGTIGPPVLIQKRLFNVFKACDGKKGAKNIIQKHPDELSTITFENGKIDIDTPAEWDYFIINNKIGH